MNVIEGPQGAEFSPGAAAHVPPMEPHMSTLAIGDDMSHVSETRDMSSDL